MEKLPSKNAIFYYSRVRFAVNLIPYMEKVPILRRCVFVFGSGLEGKVVTMTWMDVTFPCCVTTT